MALTWQNVSPSNPAGILQAGNMAAANIVKGLDVVGSSMQEYAGDAKDAETGKLLLMLDNAKDRNARQNVLARFDMDYVDKDIIAKDNQEFEAREQQREDVLFSQDIQTEEAAAKKAQRAFMRDDALLQRQARIESDAATAKHRVTTLENAAKEAALKLKQYTEGLKYKTVVTKRDADLQQRMYEQRLLAEKNAETARAENEARNLLEAQRKKTVFDQGQTEWTKKQQLDKAGKDLVATTNPLIDGTNDISKLIEIRKDLRNRKIEDNPKADALIAKTNTKIGSIVNISNLFPSKPGVPPVTMTIEGTTQAAKNRSHNNNLQKTIDKLSVYLPNSTPDDLKSMAETVLRKSSPGYGKEMSALKVPSEELNNALAFKLKSQLQELRQSGGGLTLDEIQTHRDHINSLEINKDTATGIEKSLKRLNEEYVKVFTRTPLINIIPEESRDKLDKYLDLGTLPWPADKVVDKKAVKQRHKSNIQNIIDLMPATHRNKLSYEEIQQKVSNYLTRQPAYASVLDDAKITYDTDTAEKAAKANFKWAGIRETIDDNSSIEAITKAYAWADKNLVETRHVELTKLTERLNKKLDK